MLNIFFSTGDIINIVILEIFLSEQIRSERKLKVKLSEEGGGRGGGRKRGDMTQTLICVHAQVVGIVIQKKDLYDVNKNEMSRPIST